MIKAEKSYINILKEKSRELIIMDGSTMLKCITSAKGTGVVILSLLPYIALYCRSSQEFLGEKYIPDDIDSQINDLRNGLKIYSGKYGKGKKATLESDNEQDREFREMLKFSFMKDWNIHYNLGVYFDVDGHIVGNTQNLNYYLNIPNTNITEKGERAFQIGRLLGEKIILVLNNIMTQNVEEICDNINWSQYGYRDFNTNRKSEFFQKSQDKELYLIILHILSSIGFVEHVLCLALPDNNQWGLRIEYIATHYAWSGLKKIKQHFEQEKNSSLFEGLNVLLEKGSKFFSSKLRNCMMHYDLCDKDGKPIIIEKYYDENIPFYGLIESCYNGQTCEQFFKELKEYIRELEDYLNTWFKIDIDKIKWD